MHPASHASGRNTPLLRPDSRGPPPLPEPLPLRASPAEAAQAYRQLAAVRSEVDTWFERHVAGLYQMRQWANDNVDALRMRCDGSRPGTAAAASRVPATPPPRGPSRTGEEEEAPWVRSMPTTPPRSMIMTADRMGGVGTPMGDTMVGSPQSHSKLALEDLLMSVGVGRDDRTGATPGFRSPGLLAGSPALNFDALVDNLTRGESVTPRHHNHHSHHNHDEAPAARAAFARPPPMSDGHGWAVSSGAHAGAASSAPTPMAAGGAGMHAGGGGGAHVVPMDSLMLRYGHSVTTRRRLEGYDDGRPVVSTAPGAEEEDVPPADIAVDTPCQLLVQFKRRRVAQVQSGFYVAPGRHVLVSGDRGDDLGLVLFTASRRPDGSHAVLGLANAALTRSVGVSHGTVQRVATPAEVHALVSFGELEQRAVAVSALRVEEHGLPMRILDAEYQFDRKKLTLFYESPHRLDFREMVKDLYKCFRARIWMEPAGGDDSVRPISGHGHANSSSTAALQQPPLPPSQPGFAAAAAPTKSFGISSSAATNHGGGFQLSHTSAPFVPASLQSGITMDPATLFGAPMEW